MYMSKDYVYPLKTYDKLESDPINNITNALSKLGTDESCAIQMVLRPTNNRWQVKASRKSGKLQKNTSSGFTLNPLKWIAGIFGILATNPEENNAAATNDDGSALESETVKLIDEKGKKIGYNAVIRIVTT